MAHCDFFAPARRTIVRLRGAKEATLHHSNQFLFSKVEGRSCDLPFSFAFEYDKGLSALF